MNEQISEMPFRDSSKQKKNLKFSDVLHHFFHPFDGIFFMSAVIDFFSLPHPTDSKVLTVPEIKKADAKERQSASEFSRSSANFFPNTLLFLLFPSVNENLAVAAKKGFWKKIEHSYTNALAKKSP